MLDPNSALKKSEVILKFYKKSMFKAVLVGALALGLSNTFAQITDSKLQNYGNNFKKFLPFGWTYQAGGWSYLDATACFLYQPTCYGNNPLGSYGSPTLLDPATQQMSNVLQMNSDEAIVMIFRTPASMRYFGFTQYLFQKGVTTATSPIFSSLSDSLNLKKIGTTGSAFPGQNVFGQYGAIIWTGDMNTYFAVQASLLVSGLPLWAINFMPLPVKLPAYPLHTGYGAGHDTYQMIMRTALPADPGAFASYRAEAPFIVSRVGPSLHLFPLAAPTAGYANDKTSKLEDASSALQTAMTTLSSSIATKYGSTYLLKNLSVGYSNRTGWDCISGDTVCNGDTHDALYSSNSASAIQFKGTDDFVIVTGVNHQKTGWATYQSHTVYDTVKLAGIAAVSDSMLTSASALYHAGVTDPKDPRNAQFSNLYAYMISYNCAGKSYCLQIPPPTPSNPVGLNPGSPFFAAGRSYLNPATGVRPSASEVVHDVAIVGYKR